MENTIILKNKTALRTEKQLAEQQGSTFQKMAAEDYMVAFSGLTKSYCVGMVDMVNSTKISAGMNEIEWCKYYGVFLNSMAKILPRFGGKVIKNQGDSLLFYFPESSGGTKLGFIDPIESSITMVEENERICQRLKREGLPRLNYRVSLDYGKVVIMNSNNSLSPDLIGPPVNMCAKINHQAATNGVVIGGDLYQHVKEIRDYHYSQKQGFSIGFRYSYPVYEVTRT